MTSKKRRLIINLCSVAAAILLVLGVFLILQINGVFRSEDPDKDRYPVRGIDAASEQGSIDWESLSGQGLRFAYVEATEKTDYVDPYFESNWKALLKTDMVPGAYHVFSLEHSGTEQAEHFIETVDSDEMKLPPAVRVSLTAESRDLSEEKQSSVRKELHSLLEELEKHYGKKPLLYLNKDDQEKLLDASFSDYPVWIKDTIGTPEKAWKIWEYTDEGSIDGVPISGLHLDVFNGSESDFEDFIK